MARHLALRDASTSPLTRSVDASAGRFRDTLKYGLLLFRLPGVRLWAPNRLHASQTLSYSVLQNRTVSRRLNASCSALGLHAVLSLSTAKRVYRILGPLWESGDLALDYSLGTLFIQYFTVSFFCISCL